MESHAMDIDLPAPAMTASAVSLQPIALLVDALRSESANERIQAMQRLPTIALALGVERSKAELIAFLQNSLDDDDEVLAAMAGQLPALGSYLGDVRLVLPLVETLLAADETLVRQEAVSALEAILRGHEEKEILGQEEQQQNLRPLIIELLGRLVREGGDWFAKRASAAQAIGRLAESLGEGSEPLELLSLLSQDESPTVRKAVAQAIGPLIRHTPPLAGESQQHLAIVRRLAADLQDSVRLLSVEGLIALGEKGCCSNDLELSLAELYSALVTDASWRIRFMVAKEHGRLAAAMPVASAVATQAFCSLLRDGEAEVRAAAAAQIGPMGQYLKQQQQRSNGDNEGSDTLAVFLGAVREACADPADPVRTACAVQLNRLSVALGGGETVASLLPLIVQLLGDDASEVRLAVIAGLEETVRVVGVDVLYTGTLLPAMERLSEDGQWRVREGLVDHLPSVARLLGPERWADGLLPMVRSWLDDPVSAVREAAVRAIVTVAGEFGPAFSQAQLPGLLAELSQRPNYLRRQLFASLLSELAARGLLSFGQCWEQIERLVADPVPNVRHSMVVLLESLLSHEAEHQSRLIGLLQTLQSDPDAEVSLRASAALLSKK